LVLSEGLGASAGELLKPARYIRSFASACQGYSSPSFL